MTCPSCSGPGTVLGALGRATWYRCRCCGAQWSTFKRKPVPKPAKETTP